MKIMDDFNPALIRESAGKSDSLQALSGHLRRGELVLLLGAGVSRAFGLPDWGELVSKCEGLAKIDPDPTVDLKDRMDRVFDLYKGDFSALVREGLYGEEFLAAGTYPDRLLEVRMLIALGALVMSSVRGSVADVLTLNFDDLLDWYLHLHGFRTQIVQNMPKVFRGDVDVRIHHIHGFLPLTGGYQRSEWLVLSRESFVDALSADSYAPWPTLISSQFQSKMVLVIGSSMDDIDVDVILRRAQKVDAAGARRGFVLGKQMSDTATRKCLRYNLTPLSFESYEEIPEFLLQVCQEAAAI